jgi:transcriptional antiterminator NusG
MDNSPDNQRLPSSDHPTRADEERHESAASPPEGGAWPGAVAAPSTDLAETQETGRHDAELELDEEEDDTVAGDEFDQYEGDVEPLEELPTEETDESIVKNWYILKVQSNRENSICEGLARRVAIAGLDRYFGEIIVPTEDVAEFKNGKRRVVKRKLYPGYIVVNMALNDETWFLVRDTPGIGDFTGAAGKPTPMLPEEVERIRRSIHPEEEGTEAIKTAIPFHLGDRVRIKEGTFENFEGDVEGIDEANGRVTVMINIFGRSTPVELEHWQIEAV